MEIIGKVGSKGEIYLPKMIREKLGLDENTMVEYKITPNMELKIRKLNVNILKMPFFSEISKEDLKKISEDLKREGKNVEFIQ